MKVQYRSSHTLSVSVVQSFFTSDRNSVVVHTQHTHNLNIIIVLNECHSVIFNKISVSTFVVPRIKNKKKTKANAHEWNGKGQKHKNVQYVLCTVLVSL